MEFITLFSAPANAGEWILLIAAIMAIVGILAYAGFITYKLIKNGQYEKLKEAIIKAIKEAEKTHGTGEDKLARAVEIVRAYCEGIGMKINPELLGWIVSYIREYIADHNELEEIEEQEGK